MNPDEWLDKHQLPTFLKAGVSKSKDKTLHWEVRAGKATSPTSEDFGLVPFPSPYSVLHFPSLYRGQRHVLPRDSVAKISFSNFIVIKKLLDKAANCWRNDSLISPLSG